MKEGNYEFSILGHWKDKELKYELQILQENKIIAFPFKSANAPRPSESITTLMSAKNITCKCLGGIGDVPGSRIAGEFSSVERDPSWINFEGVTKKTKEVYLPLIKGKVQIKNTEMSTELIFNSKEITGRWLMRALPNIYDKLIEGENMNLLWKPETVDSILKKPKVSGETEKINSMMSVEVTQVGESEFEVILAAEGSWTDRFGQKFIYTKEFINTLYTNMNMQVLEGKIPLGVDMEHNKIDNGRITKLELLDHPIAQIKGRGYFNGSIKDTRGASIDAELDVFFQKDLQSWIPVNGITKRVSLVANPACKVCYFTPKAG